MSSIRHPHITIDEDGRDDISRERSRPTSRGRPLHRHQLDYTIQWSELQSEEMSAVSWNQDDSLSGRCNHQLAEIGVRAGGGSDGSGKGPVKKARLTLSIALWMLAKSHQLNRC
jgi:hypothetical protein